MKIKSVFLLSSLTMALGIGVFAGVSGLKERPVEEAKADGITIDANSNIYLNLGTSGWDAAEAKIFIWNHAGGCADEFVPANDGSGYLVATITVATNGFNIMRGPDLNPDHKYNQTNDSVFYSDVNLINAWGFNGNNMTFGWGTYDGGADIHSGTFYFRQSEKTHNYGVYTVEYIEVGGVSVKKELMGWWNDRGTLLPATTKTWYNPGNVTWGEPPTPTSNGGILKVDFSFYDINNVTVKILDRNDSTKESKAIKKDASGDREVELSLGAYYYATNDGWDIWTGLTYDDDMGYDAALAYDLDKMDLCNLSKDVADNLRDRMDKNKGYVTYATWWDETYQQTFYYNDAYKLVDSKCTTPKAQKSSIAVSNTEGSNTAIVIALASTIVAIICTATLFTKKKEN